MSPFRVERTWPARSAADIVAPEGDGHARALGGDVSLRNSCGLFGQWWRFIQSRLGWDHGRVRRGTGGWGVGRERSSANDLWYETSVGQFQLLPAAETQLTPNNGVVHIKVSQSKPTTGVLVAVQQPWVKEALDKAAALVDFKSFDKNADGIL